MHLYPDKHYNDITELGYYDINHPTEYSRFVVRSYVQDPTNYDLQPAVNLKKEIRVELSFGGNSLSVVYFRENMSSGFRYMSVYAPYAYRDYDETAIDAASLAGQPSLDGLPYEERRKLDGYTKAGNGSRIDKEGVEFQFSSARIRPLRTRITFNGAWFRSAYSNSLPMFESVSDVVDNVVVGDRYVGLYDWNDGRTNQTLNTNLMLDTQIPEWGLIFATSVQCMWFVKTQNMAKNGIPTAYMDVADGELHPYTEESANDPLLSHLIKTYNADSFRQFTVPFAMNVNLKATKSIGKFMKLSMFANKIIDYTPDYYSNGYKIRSSNMKKSSIFSICVAASLALPFFSCSDEPVVPTVEASIEIVRPEGIDDLQILKETVVFRNLSSGEEMRFDSTEGLAIPVGIYECSYEAEATYVNAGDEESAVVEGRLIGNAESVQVTAAGFKLVLPVYLSVDKDDFIFEEIFFTGTRRASGSSYIGDTYFKIYNNTDHVLYADGLAICESKFKSTQFYTYTPDIRQDEMTVHAIYVIPGNGTEHPVAPGESLVICDTGIDHRISNPNSFDLSDADFEWYDESTNPSHTDIDSPTVPNLDKWYCYTQTVFVPHNRGFSSFALARIPIGKEAYLSDYYYDYEYTMYLPAGTFPMSGSAYRLPNEWIVDGVNCSVETDRQWNVLPPSIDAGWTHCGAMDSDENRFFKSIRRKMLYLTDDGIRVLKDTNNSTADFNPDCVPSLVEMQHAAIDASGTKAERVTYDGVQPVES